MITDFLNACSITLWLLINMETLVLYIAMKITLEIHFTFSKRTSDFPSLFFFFFLQVGVMCKPHRTSERLLRQVSSKEIDRDGNRKEYTE